MNILGIGPGELILIMIVLLVVVGPERLPGLARQGGQMLVRVRNWVQQSPDAAMIMRARQEIEQELSSLRSSLLEVQSARDEVMQMAKQVNQVVTEDVFDAVKQVTQTIQNDGIKAIQQSAASAIEAANTATQAAETATAAADAATNGVAAPVAAAEAAPASNGVQFADLLSDASSQTVARARTRGASVQSALPATSVDGARNGSAASDVQLLSEQVQVLIRDLQALQQTLRERGVLDDAAASPAPTDDDTLQAMLLTDAEEQPR